jgi:uncharacterized protein
MIAYVDTSAATKLVIEEPESEQLATYLDKLITDDVSLVSSILLETELRRLAVRHNLSQALVWDVLQRFDLIEPTEQCSWKPVYCPARTFVRWMPSTSPRRCA